jgi:hypothetical protein
MIDLIIRNVHELDIGCSRAVRPKRTNHFSEHFDSEMKGKNDSFNILKTTPVDEFQLSYNLLFINNFFCNRF